MDLVRFIIHRVNALGMKVIKAIIRTIATNTAGNATGLPNNLSAETPTTSPRTMPAINGTGLVTPNASAAARASRRGYCLLSFRKTHQPPNPAGTTKKRTNIKAWAGEGSRGGGASLELGGKSVLKEINVSRKQVVVSMRAPWLTAIRSLSVLRIFMESLCMECTQQNRMHDRDPSTTPIERDWGFVDIDSVASGVRNGPSHHQGTSCRP
jgi:hypothetical protein